MISTLHSATPPVFDNEGKGDISGVEASKVETPTLVDVLVDALVVDGAVLVSGT